MVIKMHYFFNNLLLYFQALIRQTKYVVMMIKEGSSKDVNFMSPGAGVPVCGVSIQRLLSCTVSPDIIIRDVLGSNFSF